MATSATGATGTGSASTQTVSKDNPQTSSTVTKIAVPVITTEATAREGHTQNMQKRPRSPEHQGPNKSARTDEKTSASSKPEAGNREIEFKATRVDEGEFKAALALLQTFALAGEVGGVVSKGSVIQEDHYLDHPIF